MQRCNDATMQRDIIIISTSFVFHSRLQKICPIAIVSVGFNPTCHKTSLPPCGLGTRHLFHASHARPPTTRLFMSGEYPLNVVTWRRAVTVANPVAKEWFQRGLNWMYGFHHVEAIRCFERVVASDPECLLAYWGIAYSHSPNYNFYKDVGYYIVSNNDADGAFPSQKEAGLALSKAVALMDDGGHEKYKDVECALVNALRLRFSSWPPSPYAHALESAYHDAMVEVGNAFPDDPDVVFARVDATMVLRPWKLWDLKTGIPTEEAVEVEPILVEALSRWPEHPGLCHLYVHLMEMSPFPEKCLGACKVLRDLQTDSGHLIHMASHIDVLVGDYRSAVDSNVRALVADNKCIQSGGGGEPGSFYSGYISHDCHMLVYAAILGGLETEAREAAIMMLEYVNEDTLAANPLRRPYQEPFVPQLIHVLLRFGRWDEILDQPFPKDQAVMPYTHATLLYARAVALAVSGRVDEAIEEEKAFLVACKHEEMAGRRLHNNLASDLLAAKAEMLRGEVEYRQGHFSAAFAHLRKAVEMEDALPYDEPWGIMQPCRHALGALLLEQNHVDEAIEVYLADMAPGRHPENPWALRGLLNCYEQNQMKEEGKRVEERLRRQQERCGGTSKDIVHSCCCAGRPIVAQGDNLRVSDKQHYKL